MGLLHCADCVGAPSEFIRDVQPQQVYFAPGLQFFHLLPVPGLIAVSDESPRCCVVCELDNMIAQMLV